MMDWERDELINVLTGMLEQSERDVQERIVWHFFMIHDDYGQRIAKNIGLTVDDVKHLGPLAVQDFTEEEKQRLANLGNNGDTIDPEQWGTWTSSVVNHQVSAEDVLSGKLGSLTYSE